MSKVHLSTILRTAAYRNLRPWGDTDREKVRFSCIAAWNAGYQLTRTWTAGDAAEEYDTRALYDCGLSTYPDEVFPVSEGWYSDNAANEAQQGVRFMWLLFLSLEARDDRSLYLEIQDGEAD